MERKRLISRERFTLLPHLQSRRNDNRILSSNNGHLTFQIQYILHFTLEPSPLSPSPSHCRFTKFSNSLLFVLTCCAIVHTLWYRINYNYWSYRLAPVPCTNPLTWTFRWLHADRTGVQSELKKKIFVESAR